MKTQTIVRDGPTDGKAQAADHTGQGDEPARRRIVSLLASITEILGALGVSDDIVGVTHCCDYPPSALQGAMVVTTSDIRPALMSQEEIHQRVSGALRRGDSLYALDEVALQKLQPTHVFTQSLCDICAVSAPLVHKTCARIFSTDDDDMSTGVSPKQQIVSLEPETLEDVWETIRVAGRVLDVESKADQLIETYRQDLLEIQQIVQLHLKTQSIERKPKVAFLEWHDPFVSGGHWIADMIDIAGGEYTLNKSGQRSACISDETLADYDPDVILIGPCGFDTHRATKDTLPLLHHPTRSVWNTLRAVLNQNVFALDGNAYYARPGPRLVQGTGLIAKCIYPDINIPEHLAPSAGVCKITLDMYLPPPPSQEE